MRALGSQFYAQTRGGKALVEILPDDATDEWLAARAPFLAAHKENARKVWAELVYEGAVC